MGDTPGARPRRGPSSRLEQQRDPAPGSGAAARRPLHISPLAVEEFQHLAELASDAILVVDPAWRFLFVNRAAERLLRRRRQRLVGRKVADALPGVAASAVFEAAERCATAGSAVAEEQVAVAALKRWVGVRCEPRAAEYGGGVLVFLRDRGQSRKMESARDEARRGLRTCRERQARLLRELLSAVTHGRLRLCGSERDLPEPLPPVEGPVLLRPDSLSGLRRKIALGAEVAGLSAGERQDLLLATGEAAMNAIVHGGGGAAEVRADRGRDRTQVWVRDRGKGIPQELLHRATLEDGWTTAGTLGFGYTLMLQAADRVYLHTGPGGTTVVLEKSAGAAAVK